MSFAPASTSELLAIAVEAIFTDPKPRTIRAEIRLLASALFCNALTKSKAVVWLFLLTFRLMLIVRPMTLMPGSPAPPKSLLVIESVIPF